ncbi:hypothetical protein ACLB2K_055173 [Fragaria x ananassa]
MTSTSRSPTVSNVTQNWSPPPPGHIKINCDAAWIESSKLTGISALARDCHGILFDGATLLCRMGSVLEAEATVAAVAIEVAKRLPPSPIILESDSKALVDHINNSKFPSDLVASLVVRKKCSEIWIDCPPSSLVFVLSRDGLPCPLPSSWEFGSP